MDLMLNIADMTGAEFQEHKRHWHSKSSIDMTRKQHDGIHRARTFLHQHLAPVVLNADDPVNYTSYTV